MNENTRVFRYGTYNVRDWCPCCGKKSMGIKYRLREPIKREYFVCDCCLLPLLFSMHREDIQEMKRFIKKRGLKEDCNGQLLPKLLAYHEKGKAETSKVHDPAGTKGSGVGATRATKKTARKPAKKRTGAKSQTRTSTTSRS